MQMNESEKLEEMQNLAKEIKLIPAFQKIEKKENLVEALFALFKTLTEEEKTTLRILYNSENPLSIRQIRKLYMIEKIIQNLEMIRKMKEIESKTFKGFEKLSHNIFEEVFKEQLKLEKITFLLKNLNDRKTAKMISELNKILPDKIPSYYKFKTVLEYLKELGLVEKRELEKRKAENVWFLSPIFSKICASVVFYIEKSPNLLHSSIEREVFKTITGRESIGLLKV